MFVRSVGSVGRAPCSHRGGHWFESSTDHSKKSPIPKRMGLFFERCTRSAEPVSPAIAGARSRVSALWAVRRRRKRGGSAVSKGAQPPLQGGRATIANLTERSETTGSIDHSAHPWVCPRAPFASRPHPLPHSADHSAHPPGVPPCIPLRPACRAVPASPFPQREAAWTASIDKKPMKPGCRPCAFPLYSLA